MAKQWSIGVNSKKVLVLRTCRFFVFQHVSQSSLNMSIWWCEFCQKTHRGGVEDGRLAPWLLSLLKCNSEQEREGNIRLGVFCPEFLARAFFRALTWRSGPNGKFILLTCVFSAFVSCWFPYQSLSHPPHWMTMCFAQIQVETYVHVMLHFLHLIISI